MSEWKKVKIGDFLTESKIIAEESDAAHRITVRLNCKGVEQRSLKAEKEGATKYYTRKAGQFIYGKQNIHKGAFGIIPQELNGFTSSADLPAFDVDLSKCIPEWICICLQKDEYYKSLQKNVKGVGSQRLAVNVFLDSEIPLPSIEIQKEVIKKIKLQLQKTEQLSIEIESQKNYIKQLRQNILQDAIEGKLTADWRKQNPVQKGNPDYDTEALFEQIQKERNSEKKHKGLSPITDEEKPFEIPKGWKWVRLGEIINLLSGRDFEPSEYNDKQEGTPYITGASNFGENGIIINRWTETPKCIAKFGDLLLVCKGSGYGTLAYADFKEAHIARQVMSITTVSELISLKYIEFILRANFQYLKSQGKGLIPGIDRETVLNICAGFPPLLEQEEIVISVEKHLQTVSDIESQITEREQLAKQLMQSILKDAFEES